MNQRTRSATLAGRGELIAKVGTVVSAIMASSCCWLPVLLLAVGISGAGIAAALETYRPVFMAVTFGFLGMAFYFTYRPRPAAAEPDCCSAAQASAGGATESSCCATQAGDATVTTRKIGVRRWDLMALNKVMLWGVTVLAVAFLFFPKTITRLFVSANQQVTAEMTRSVVRIEGMTCDG